MFSKFSEEAQKVLVLSKKEMQDLKHAYVGSEHLFLSLLKLNQDFSKKLKDKGITYKLFKEKLIEIVGIGDTENSLFLYTPLLKRIIETALLICKESSLNEVTPDHLIFALLEEGEGVAVRILNELGLDLNELQSFYSHRLTNKRKNSKKKLLVEEFGVDLTKKAQKDELDPVVGRDKDIKRVIEILCRRSKNNPLLIGDAGVGKTAIVEELARMIVKNQVPEKLKDKRIISVSIAALVSGTKYRGEFEERITKMLKELEDNDDIFLFIDEIHTIMGAGGAEGAIDAANIFKPALARGRLRLIGATTTEEYKQSIEKDRAMERRFQTIFVLEPNEKEVFEILSTLRPIYEEYHDVKIDDSCLKNIIMLSNKYIYDRKQPDKAIDLLDEVSSKVSLKHTNLLPKIDLYREELTKIKELKNKYLVNQDFDNASIINKKEKEMLTKINNLELKTKTRKLKRSIRLEDISLVISEKTNIPVCELGSIDMKYITKLSNTLHKNIIGQDEAINELVNTTKRIKLGYKDDNKPVSFLFVGPTGVGKTKLALEYGRYQFGKNIIRFDMSEYKDSSSINKILGSSPGYVGYDDGKNKLEEVRKYPYALILIDEIEKAHPSVLNLLLQILDNGKITDNKGNVVHFNNHIIIMTSNIGCGKLDLGFAKMASKNDSKLKEILSIELLNRIQKVIYFNKMNYNDIYSIVKSKLLIIKNKFKNRGIIVHLSNDIVKKIVKESRYNEFGARKIDQVIEDNVDTLVINDILNGKKEIFINKV